MSARGLFLLAGGRDDWTPRDPNLGCVRYVAPRSGSALQYKGRVVELRRRRARDRIQATQRGAHDVLIRVREQSSPKGQRDMMTTVAERAQKLADALKTRSRAYYARQHMDPDNPTDSFALSIEFASVVAETNAARFEHVRQVARERCGRTPACVDMGHDRTIVTCPSCDFAAQVLEAE